MHHVQNEHTWILGKCRHIADDGSDLSPGPPTDPDGKVIEYFDKAEPAIEALKKIILDPRWIQSLCYYDQFRLVNSNLLTLILYIIHVQAYWDIRIIPQLVACILSKESCFQVSY